MNIKSIVKSQETRKQNLLVKQLYVRNVQEKNEQTFTIFTEISTIVKMVIIKIIDYLLKTSILKIIIMKIIGDVLMVAILKMVITKAQ